MNCPKCQAKLPVSARICPNCKFFAERDLVVQTSPPRAPWWRRRKIRTIPRLRSLQLQAQKRTRRPLPISLQKLVQGVVAIVPGFGHFVAKRFLAGVAFLVIIGGSITGALLLPNEIAQWLLGFAAASHAFSILDAAFNKTALGCVGRPLIAGIILYPLLRWVYWPYAESLNRAGMANVPMARPGTLSLANNLYGNIFGFGVLLVFILLITGFLAHLISAMREAREPK